MESYRELIGVVAFLVSVIGLIMGIRVRTGADRRWIKWYHSSELPFYLRNAPLGWIPGSIGGMAIAVGVFFDRADALNALVGLIMLVGFGLVGMFFVIAWRPPSWTKPDWLRDQEGVARKPR